MCIRDRGYVVLSRLELEWKLRVDTPVFTRDGALLAASREGTQYMLKRWYTGRECDMKRETEIVSAAESLALLHERMQWDASAERMSCLLYTSSCRSGMRWRA